MENGVQGSSAGRPGAVEAAQVRDGGLESGGSRGKGRRGGMFETWRLEDLQASGVGVWVNGGAIPELEKPPGEE